MVCVISKYCHSYCYVCHVYHVVVLCCCRMLLLRYVMSMFCTYLDGSVCGGSVVHGRDAFHSLLNPTTNHTIPHHNHTIPYKRKTQHHTHHTTRQERKRRHTKEIHGLIWLYRWGIYMARKRKVSHLDVDISNR